MVLSRQQHIDQLNEQAWSLLHSDPQRSQALVEEASSLADTGDSPYLHGLAYSLLIRSILAWDRSAYPEALELALRALMLFDALGDPAKQAYTAKHIAGIHYLLGNASQALAMGFRAQRLAETSGDRALLASVLNDVGYMRLHLGDQQTALAMLERSLAMHRQLQDRYGEAQALDSLGKAYLLLGNFAQALDYEQQSLALNQAIGYPRAEVEALINLGKIHRAAADSAQALQHFDTALALAHQRGYRQLEAATLLAMGRLHLDQDRPTQAIAVLDQARAVAETIGSRPVLAEIHEALAEAHERSGNLRESLEHYKRYHALQVSVSHDQARLRLQTLEATHEAEKARQEAEIYRLKNVELQQEIAEREKLIAELDAFAHTVAHDLKNPLAVVIGYADLLYAEVATLDNASLQEMAQQLLRMALKTERIVSELLLLAAMRKEQVTLEALAMGPIVAEARLRLHQEIAQRQAVIEEPDTWPLALGYAPWIEEVWANYLSNAIKYGGTPPHIEIGATPQGDQVQFWVKDNGPGLTPEQQSNLFTEFHHLPLRQQKSHGLGLSIVKRIVEKLGGSVGIESTPGHGSVFSFTLLAAPDAPTR